MEHIEQQISEFANAPERVDATLALLKVCRDKGHTAKQCMKHIICSILLEWEGIPIDDNSKNN